MQLSKVAFLFPGQGSQEVGMGRALYEASPKVRNLFAEADAVLGYPLSQVILEGPEEELRRTANTQPAILLVSIALYQSLGLTPSVAAGHSLGEYSALVAAGTLPLACALELVHERGRLMQEAVPESQGVMLALIGADEQAVDAALRDATGIVDVANYNSPGQIVLAGERLATRAVAKRAGAKRVVELPVSAPFHCRLMKPVESRLAPLLDATRFSDPSFPVYTNVDAKRSTTGDEARSALKRQVSRAVRWTESVRKMIQDDGIDTFVEIGPGRILSGLVRRIDRTVRRFDMTDPDAVRTIRTALLQ